MSPVVVIRFLTELAEPRPPDVRTSDVYAPSRALRSPPMRPPSVSAGSDFYELALDMRD